MRALLLATALMAVPILAQAQDAPASCIDALADYGSGNSQPIISYIQPILEDLTNQAAADGKPTMTLLDDPGDLHAEVQGVINICSSQPNQGLEDATRMYFQWSQGMADTLSHLGQ